MRSVTAVRQNFSGERRERDYGHSNKQEVLFVTEE
jgi:hypothetical protein